MKKALLLIVPMISACTGIEYDCPLDTETGVCASQMTAYMSSLYSSGEGDYIYQQGQYGAPKDQGNEFYGDGVTDSNNSGSAYSGNWGAAGSAPQQAKPSNNGVNPVVGALPYSQMRYNNHDEFTNFVYNPPKIFRTWIAANVVDSAVVGNHFIYWVGDEGGWNAPNIRSGQGSDILRPFDGLTHEQMQQGGF